MNHSNDEDRLDETIARAADIGKVEFDRAKWLDRLAAEPPEPGVSGPRTRKGKSESRGKIWRTIMESKVTRYSAAAVVTLAAALVLLNPFGTSNQGSVVWGEVVDKVRETHTLIYKEEYIFSEIDQEESRPEVSTVTFSCVKYASEEYGVAEDVFDDKGTLKAQVYLLKETQQGMLIAHPEKKYGRVSLPGEMFDLVLGAISPRGLVEYLTAGQYKKLGRAKFDNFDVEGFESSDLSALFPFPEPLPWLFPVREITARIWVDVESSLPVGFEGEFNTGRGLLTGFEELHCEVRGYDFQWNSELPEGIFDPDIPDDYTELKVTDFIPAEAKAGLVGLGAIPAIGIIIYRRRRRKIRRRGWQLAVVYPRNRSRR